MSTLGIESARHGRRRPPSGSAPWGAIPLARRDGRREWRRTPQSRSGLRLTRRTKRPTDGTAAGSTPSKGEPRTWIAKDTGLTNLPLHGFDQNRIWCQIVALASELQAWSAMLALAGHEARRWEPKRLRYRLYSRHFAFTCISLRMWTYQIVQLVSAGRRVASVVMRRELGWGDRHR